MLTALAALLTLSLDLITKYLVLRSNRPIVKNTELAFSIPVGDNMALASQAAIFAVLLFFFLKLKNNLAHPAYAIGWGLVLGGAAANLLERMVRGFVTDFIPLALSIINMADIAIFTGIVSIALTAFLSKKKV